ncbi:MAG: 5'-nucleotidase C-terminal domain-containing protein [Ardenticatenaceae bacterium]|nr:5'-nucleotidase C-terminal domain-containing protein [Ardenticatenaceae bacterium]
MIWGHTAVSAQTTPHFHLTILHTNDTHGRIAQTSALGSRCTETEAAETQCFGGVARRATVINQIRAQEDNVLLLDGGDQFQGTLFYTRYKGDEAALFMNLLGYNAQAVGNHEFDDGPANLARFIQGVNHPVLSANIDASDEPALAGLIQPYAIVEIGGEQIGIVGFTTEDTAILSSPGPNVRFVNIEIAVQAAVTQLESQGINKIIGVSHSGFGRDSQVATTVTGLDVIVSGHTNTFLSNTDPTAEGPYPTVVQSPEDLPVLLISDYAYGKYLGRLDVTFDAEGVPTAWEGEPILLDSSISEDPAILAQVEQLNEPLQTLMAQVVGTAVSVLDGDRASCRFAECTMGNLITDAILWQTAAEDTQIAIMNGGSIRRSIPAGNVSLGDVLEVLPFSNTIATFKLTGADLWDALENGISRAQSAQSEGTGRFPQVSGLRFTWNVDEPAGSRLVSVEIHQTDGSYASLDPAATYKIATNDFLRRGGDGYTQFMDKAIDPYDAGDNLEEAVAAYIMAQSPINPQIEGRIIQIHSQANPIFSGGLLVGMVVFLLLGLGTLWRPDAAHPQHKS